MPSQTRTAPKLPRELLDQIQPNTTSSKRSQGQLQRPHNRRDKRKLERLQKKSQKSQARSRHDSKFHSVESGSGSEGEEVEEYSVAPPEKIIRKGASSLARPTKHDLRLRDSHNNSTLTNHKNGQSADHLQPWKLSKKVQKDDAEIAALEAKLGILGKAKLPKSFQEDGLDLLLEGLDKTPDSERGANKKAKRDEDEKWLKRKRRRLSETGLASEDGSDEAFASTDDEESISGFDDPPDDEEDSVDASISGATDDDEHVAEDEEPLSTEAFMPKRVRENPYIAPPVAASSASQKYVPPSLRMPSESESELKLRLKRQIVGLLNRLSDANVLSLLGDLENMYQNHPRQVVTSILTERLVDLISDRTALNDTFIILHAGFIAAVYKIIGPDFGAQLLELIVTRLGQKRTGFSEHETGEKSEVNLISLLDRLYMFQVISCALIFDYIRMFLQDLSETNTELLLRVVKDVGPQLRHDDPLSLKDIVLMLQQSVASTGEINLSVRTKFMIETINDLKNNRMKTGVAAHVVVHEHTTRMKKTLGSLNTRTIRASEPLRVSLADIEDTEKKGKWWLIGASWKGNSGQNTNLQRSSETNKAEEKSHAGDDAAADLLQIAREQRMNTDIRRAIFISIMSALDYKDAHLRMTKLRLKKSQELEIPRVLLHCARAEERYNPYYTLIAKKLCAEHKLKMAFQFALWDLFKRMGESGEFGDSAEAEDEDGEDGLSDASIVNLAKLYGTLICHGLLGLDVLKAVDLVYLQPRTKVFGEVMLITVMLGCKQSKQQPRALERIFEGAKPVAGLAKGLQYFLKKTVAKSDLVSSPSERATIQSGCKKAIRVLSDSSTAIDDFR